MNHLTTARLLERARSSFWFLPGLALILAVAGGLLLPRLDAGIAQTWSDVTFGGGPASARQVLGAIVTVEVSLMALSFSVTVVALQLAAQQLSPQVLRTFRSNRLNQVTLAAFLFTPVLALLLLRRVREAPDPFVPDLSVTLAIIAAMVSFALFVAFVHGIVVSLAPAAVIASIADSGRGLAERPYPLGEGRGPEDVDAARAELEEATRGEGVAVRADRGGFLTAIDVAGIVTTARAHDGVVRQARPVGEYVLPGEPLAEVWAGDDGEALADAVSSAFEIERERTPVQDETFPIEQLGEVALKSLSPALNALTTAANAASAAASLLVVRARADDPPDAIADADGTARFVPLGRGLDELVRLAFEQVRLQVVDKPVLAAHLIELLADIRSAARGNGRDVPEALRQAELTVAAAEDAGLRHEDVERLRRMLARVAAA